MQSRKLSVELITGTDVGAKSPSWHTIIAVGVYEVISKIGRVVDACIY